jgi:hypothetical protein
MSSWTSPLFCYQMWLATRFMPLSLAEFRKDLEQITPATETSDMDDRSFIADLRLLQ